MANDEMLTDDYVASLLAKDAKESSIKYSALGLEAFAPSKYETFNYCLQFTDVSRPPVSKPKPNTRFLRNIIKDTDNHNAALLAKEAAESRARLQSLANNEHREGKASRVGGGDIRRRQLGDIAAILGGRPNKRRKTEGSGNQADRSRRVNTSSEDEEPGRNNRDDRRKRLKSREENEDGEISSRSRHRRQRSKSEDRGKSGDGRRSRRSVSEDRDTKGDYRRRQHRSRSPREHRITDSRRRHRSPRRKRPQSPHLEERKENLHRSHRKLRSPSADNKESKNDSEKPVKEKEPKLDSDSDPLDDIIGPRPPPIPEVRSRGRGTMSHASGIDSRFSAAYDPTVDVQLDIDEENDWDQALEALRDRQKWKQQGADRLRAAGFTEDEISKWEKGGEKREEDVKWAKKGEGREWDRGKVIDDNGGVTIESQYGRLKDS